MALTAAVVGGPVASVPAAIERMDEIGAALDPRDGIARFNHLYRQVTSEVDRCLSEGTFFEDNQFLATLDVAFANRYLDALRLWTGQDEAGHPTRTPKPWKVLFGRRARPGITPAQFAAAGVNAHINFDLPLALTAAWNDANVGRPEDDSVQRADYDKVTDIFGILYQRFRDDVLPEWWDDFDHGEVEDGLNRASHVVVDKARDFAWTVGKRLDRVRHHPRWIARMVVEANEALTGQTAHLLLEPVLRTGEKGKA